MSEQKDCVVKLIDDHGVEHSVCVRAESVYEAALKGLKKLERVGWESNGQQIGSVTVEVYEEPTCHRVSVAKLLQMAEGLRTLSRRRDQKGKVADAHQVMILLEQFASDWQLKIVGDRIPGCYGYIEEHNGELWVWTHSYSPGGHKFFRIEGWVDEFKAVYLMRPEGDW